MQTIHTITELRQALQAGPRPAFVPTMGNLHEGHLALVRQARASGLPVVASVFVNRLQFAPNEDFDRYPRTLQNDCALLQGAGCDIVFAPDEREMYPAPQGYHLTPPPALADILEGQFRPGFFTGVCTVVMKLFQIVQPGLAVFGKKDYQQLRVIEGMVRDFALPMAIAGGDTVRAEDGLALSSRNGYLDADARRAATALHAQLRAVAAAAGSDAQGTQAAEQAAMQALRALGWRPDYVAVRRRADLQPAGPGDTERVVLAAAWLGNTRLIDNLEF